MTKRRLVPAAAALALLLVLCGCAQRYTAEELARAREEAYQSGYEAGTLQGADQSRDAHFQEGYDLGLTEGLAQLDERERALLSEAGDAFQQGYDSGYETGYAQKKSETQAARARYEASIAPQSPDGDASVSRAEDTPASAQEASDTATVYITQSGTKYHSSGCTYLSKSRTSISLADARAKGYAPCSRCHPPQ